MTQMKRKFYRTAIFFMLCILMLTGAYANNTDNGEPQSPVSVPEAEYSIDGGSTWVSKDSFIDIFFVSEFLTAPDGIVRLNRDVFLSGLGSVIPAMHNVTINGNGHTIYRGEKTAQLFMVNVSGSQLTLKNVTIDGGAVWDDPSNMAERQNTGFQASGTANLFYIDSGASVILEEGAILQNNHLSGSTQNGAAVEIVDGTLTMKSGSVIRNNTATGNGTYGGGGGAIHVNAGSAFIMEGGEISGNYASVNGGAVTSRGTLEIRGGKLTQNSAASGGGAVMIESGSLTMNGGEITQNNALLGSVCIMSGHFLMQSGEITENAATQGGGIVAYGENSSVEMRGGSVANNTSKTMGGGIFIRAGSLSLSGTPDISGNTAKGKADNIYLYNNNPIAITGEINKNDAGPIGVGMTTPGVFTDGWNTYMGEKNPSDYFTSDLADYRVKIDENNQLQLAEKPGPTEAGPFIVTGGQLGIDYEYDNTSNILNILTDVPLEITAKSNPITYAAIAVTTGVDANIALNNLKIDLKNCNGSALTVPTGSTIMLTLIGENLLRSYAAGPGILVDNGAKLTISGENTETLEVYGAQMEYYSDQGDTSGGFACGFAGIGGQNTSGGAYTYTGEIVINGGKIDAHGFGFGAGIGGGDYGSGGTITINGGIVTATTGEGMPAGWNDVTSAQASGIGASQGQPGGIITITGGTVTAIGGYGCAGIGGGTADVIIRGGNVTAYGGPNAAGIGGYDQNKGEIKITIGADAKVTAYGGSNACGIGQGKNSAAKVTLHIENGAEVYAFSQENSNRPAITETANQASDPASMINAYITNMTLPASVPITAQAGSDTNDLTVPAGAAGVAFTTAAAGEYTAKTAVSINGITYQFIRQDLSKATVTSSAAFAMEKVKAVAAANFTKEPTPSAQADYENDRLTGLIPNGNYRLEVQKYFLNISADANGAIAHPDFPNFYGLNVSIVKLGNGTDTLDSDPQILQTVVPAVTGIMIKTQPAKTNYTLGGLADWSGLSVTLSYAAGSQKYEKDIVFADFEANGIRVSPVSGTALNTIGNSIATVSYGELNDNFTVNVAKEQQEALVIAAIPPKTFGDAAFSLDITGGSGSGTLSFEITAGSSVSIDETGKVTILSAGESTIKVTKAADGNYAEITATVTVHVAPAPSTVVTAPTSKRIRRGQQPGAL